MLRLVSNVTSMSISLSVCSHNSKTARPNFTKFLPLAVARFSSDGVAIQYVSIAVIDSIIRESKAVGSVRLSIYPPIYFHSIL